MAMSLEDELRNLARHRARPEWNETDVREEILAPLLRLLGYRKDTDYDINREQSLLTHPFLMAGRHKVRLDYAVLARRRHMWVLEAKRPSEAIGAEEIHQAYHYAIHPEVQARFFAVCNGLEFALFDVREVDERYVPTLRFELKDLVQHFPALRNILGHDRVRDEVARRALQDLANVLQTEVRIERVDAMDRQLRSMLAEARKAADENARALRHRKMEQADEDLRTMHAGKSPIEIARVAFEFLDTEHVFGIAFGVFKEKLLSLAPSELERELEEIQALLDGDLISSHRANVMRAMLRLSPDLAPKLRAAVRTRIHDEVAAILAGFSQNERARLLWKLEGLVKRVPYKISMVRRTASAQLAEIVSRKRATLPEEDLVADPPSVWGERFVRSHRKASQLFHFLKAGDASALSSTIAEFEKLESEVDGAYREATLRGFDGDPVPPYFVYFDDPLDSYRSVLCHALLKEFDETSQFADDAILAEIETALRRVQRDVYSINHADVLWVRLIHARGGMDVPLDPENGSPLAAEGVHRLMSRSDIHRSDWSALDSGVIIRGEIAPGRWAQYPAQLDLANRRVIVGPGSLR
jgi:hypothetical protein